MARELTRREQIQQEKSKSGELSTDFFGLGVPFTQDMAEGLVSGFNRENKEESLKENLKSEIVAANTKVKDEILQALDSKLEDIKTQLKVEKEAVKEEIANEVEDVDLSMFADLDKEYELSKTKEVEELVEKATIKATEKLKEEVKQLSSTTNTAKTKKKSGLKRLGASLSEGIITALEVIMKVLGILIVVFVCVIVSFLISESATPPKGIDVIVDFIRPYWVDFWTFIGNWISKINK